ncbi:Peflin [Dactylellina cionopaga]|nr:Peflin [Dactylellina cionopaga]
MANNSGAPPGGPPGYGKPPLGYAPHYGGGYVSPGLELRDPPGAPPPGADPQLWNWFSAVDTDRSGHLTPSEVQNALINGDCPFDLDTVKLLMSIFDTDRSGTIGFNEFLGLWKYIKDWQNVFKHFDTDRSDSINSTELTNAFAQFGYNLSPSLIVLLTKKYATPSDASGINFDRFVRCCVVVKQVSEAFGKHDASRSGWVQMNYDQFMQVVLTLP